MKRLLLVFLSVSMLVPLFARDNFDDEYEKAPFSFARQYFEIGIDAGAGFGNDLIGLKDALQKEIVIDLNKLEESIKDDGANINVSGLGNFFFNIKGINIGGGKWDFGIFAGAEGRVDVNIPKSLFTLISKGNRYQHIFTDDISIFGGVFAEAGLKTQAKYGKLRVGITPSLHAPLIYIPKSDINYVLNTEDGVFFTSEGKISVYSPFTENGELKFGFDLSLQGEYALLSFLDIGGTISHIPIVPATLQNRMLFIIKSKPYEIKGQNIFDGNDIDSFEFEEREKIYDSSTLKVYRPLRFDAYARFKPLGGRELLVLTPSVGFTVVIGEEESYFNFGAEARLNLKDLFIPYVSFNRQEGLWQTRFGFAFNLRAFELDLETALQSQTFKGCFTMKGLSLNLGLRFGW